MKITVKTYCLEPGTHLSRKPTTLISTTHIELPDEECKEPRPDWGEYLPLVTFRAIERALDRRGALPPLGPDHRYFMAIA